MTLTSDAGGDERADPSEEAELAIDFFRGIGKQIKLLRERAGMTQRELGQRLGYSFASVQSMENGRRTPHADFLSAVDELLDAGGVLKAVEEDVLEAKAHARVRHPAWFRDYARMEAEAVELHEYCSLTMPGLFQTEAHSRALYHLRKPLLDEEVMDRRVTARLARQEILSRSPAPIVSAVIEESVLRRPIGGWEVHQGQLEHLLRLGDLRNIEIQVMPMDREGHAGMSGPFILLTPKGRHQVGYLETQHSGRLISDLEGVRVLALRYGSIRGQALTPRESKTLIEKFLGER